MSTVIEFLKQPGVYSSVFCIALASITINFHNRLDDEEKKSKFVKFGNLFGIGVLVISVLLLGFILYKANETVIKEAGGKLKDAGGTLKNRVRPNEY